MHHRRPDPIARPVLPEGTRLKQRAHPTREDGMCFMEAIAWLTGEEHTDQPICVGEFVGYAVVNINDSARSNPRRTEALAPLIPRVVGTWYDEFSPVWMRHMVAWRDKSKRMPGGRRGGPGSDTWNAAMVELVEEMCDDLETAPLIERFPVDPDAEPQVLAAELRRIRSEDQRVRRVELPNDLVLESSKVPNTARWDALDVLIADADVAARATVPAVSERTIPNRTADATPR